MLSFDVEKSWEDQGTGYMEDLMKHIMWKEGKTHLSVEMEPAKFTQVSRALSVVKRSEPTFPCWMLVFPSYLSS